MRSDLNPFLVEVFTAQEEALSSLKSLQMDDFVFEVNCQPLWYAFARNSLDMLGLGSLINDCSQIGFYLSIGFVETLIKLPTLWRK